MSDRFRTSLGLDPTAKGVAGLVTALQAVEASAVGGALTMGQLHDALSQLDTALMDGVVTGEQYTSLVATLTTAWSNAQGVLSALRQGQIAVEQAIDANWRPNLDARLSDAGLSGAAIEALRPTWQAVLDAAKGGTASAAQMRSALAALDAQLTAATITAEQHRTAVGILTSAWQDNASAVSAVSQQLSTSWSEVVSGLAEGWRTVASDSRQAATAWSGVADALEQASRDVMLDKNLSNLGPRALRDAAQAEFDRLRTVVSDYAAAAQAGTATDAQRTAALAAAQQIDDAGKKYLEAQRAYSGDGTAYDQSLTDVKAAWDASRQLGLTLKDAETRRADQIDRQIDQLERLTGVSSASRQLLDQIKGTITAGNADMAQLVALVRQLPGYQRYGAPADVQAGWNAFSTGARQSVANRLGFSGSADDPAFNDFLVASGKGGDFEALVRAIMAAQATPYGASAEAQAAWDRMSDAGRTDLMRARGWQGSVDDRWMNYFLVGTAQTGGFEAQLRAMGVPGFAAGGHHAGGLRVVGERGRELEATGPARYWSADQTRDILAPRSETVIIDMAPVVTAIGAVRSAVLEIGGQIAAMAARLAGVEDAIDNQSAEIRMLGNRLSKLVRS